MKINKERCEKIIALIGRDNAKKLNQHLDRGKYPHKALVWYISWLEQQEELAANAGKKKPNIHLQWKVSRTTAWRRGNGN